MKLRMGIGVAMLFGLMASPAQAAKPLPHDPSLVELVMLPDYCQARLGANAEVYQKWNKRMGPDKFIHLHHYCGGLKFMNRYTGTLDKQLRRYYLQNAIGEFDYVIRHWPDGFALKEDAKKRKAEAISLMKLL